MIVVPTALQIFGWIATIWTARRLQITVPFLYAASFFFVFIIGGLTGVMLAVGAARPAGARHLLRRRAPALRADRRIARSRCSARSCYWFPKMTGRMMGERLGQAELLAALRRLQPDVLPDAPARAGGDAAAGLHLSGGDGLAEHEPAGHGRAPRSSSCRCSSTWSTSSSACAAASVAGANPWGGSTLEWATSSPPPPYNFLPQPTVASREPLWHPELTPPPIVGAGRRQARGARDRPARRRARSPLQDARAVAVAAADGDRHVGHVRLVDLPGDGVVWGAIPTFLCLDRLVLADAGQRAARAGRRHRPAHAAGEPVVSGRRSRVALDVSALPTYAFGHRSVMWWATMCMIAIEGTAFALAITSYLYLKGRVPHWPPAGPTPGTVLGHGERRHPAGRPRGRTRWPRRPPSGSTWRGAAVDGGRAGLRARLQRGPLPRVRRSSTSGGTPTPTGR